MGDHAVSVAKAAKYEGAGTIEFIVDNKLNYFFLEMNTRLQVEHPITERVTGIDLVREQINIANGLELAYEQNELSQNGHAIECRIYAEDPDNNFMPSPGLIQHITEPLGFGVRHDGYVYEGFEIPIYYDPLISKLIVWGKTRPEAIARMKRALHTYKITGVKTSIKFLERIMNAPDFVEGQYDTHFIEKNRSFLEEKESCVGDCKAMAIIAAFIDYHNRIAQTQQRVAEVKSGSEWKTKNRKKNLLRM
jgi:acetyl-CoA carboxylase biotin carboxylase subunit